MNGLLLSHGPFPRERESKVQMCSNAPEKQDEREREKENRMEPGKGGPPPHQVEMREGSC